MHFTITTNSIVKLHQKNPIIQHFFHSSSSDHYTKLINACIRNQALQSGRTLHAHLIVNGLVHSTHFASKLIKFYAQFKLLTHARKVFDEIPKSNIPSWVAAIGSYARYGFYEETMSMFSKMQREGLGCDRIVLPSVLKACGHLSDRDTGEKLHAIVLKNEYEVDAFVMTALIDMYSKCGMIEKAKRVFDHMVEKDLVALNAIVSGYVQNGEVKEAFDLVEEMKILGMKPNVVTWNTLIAGFSQANNKLAVEKIFKIMDENGVKPDVVSWTSVITGFVQNSEHEEAFHGFQKMLSLGLFPTSDTICGILPAAANIADLRLGMEIHGYAVSMGVEENVYVRSALIDMYAKCGSISEATLLFQKMSERNTVTWNSMIFGYANNGYCNEAVEFFNRLLAEEERKIDHLTFTAVLTACSHAGMVRLGESLFEMMKEKFGILPRLEHYACMVDLLGRAGKLDEAYDLINKMPIDANAFVWGALLGACRLHGNVNLAEIAAKHVAKLEPESSGSSVLLSNLYADVNKWGNVTKVKKMIKKRRLKRFPSYSWVDVV